MTALPSAMPLPCCSVTPLSTPPQLRVTGHGSLEPDMSPAPCQLFLGTTPFQPALFPGGQLGLAASTIHPWGQPVWSERLKKKKQTANPSKQSPFYKASVEPCGAREEAENWTELPERTPLVLGGRVDLHRRGSLVQPRHKTPALIWKMR